MLDMLRLWLHWALLRRMSALFSGRFVLSVLEFSSSSSISRSVSSTIIPMSIDFFFFFFWCFVDLFWDILLFWIIVKLYNYRFYLLCLPLSCWDIKGVIFSLFFSTIFFTLCPFETKRGSIFFLDRKCIFKPVKWLLFYNGQMGSLLVCDWLHSVWQNHFYVMLPFYQRCRLFQSLHFKNVLRKVQRRFCTGFKLEKSDPKIPSRRPSHASERPSVSRSFKQF